MDCECGLSYDPDTPADVLLHATVHDAYINGPVLKWLDLVPQVTLLGQYRLAAVDHRIAAPLREHLAEVAMVSRVDITGHKAGYYGESTEAEETMLLATVDGRGVGLVLAALDEYYWRMAWAPNGEAILLANEAVPDTRPKVGRIWVSKAHRMKGLGRALLRATSEHYGIGLDTIGWELPFSILGARLVRSVAPGEWFGRGDLYAVEQTLRLPLGAA